MLQQTSVSRSDMFRTELHGDECGCHVQGGLDPAPRTAGRKAQETSWEATEGTGADQGLDLQQWRTRAGDPWLGRDYPIELSHHMPGIH